MWEEPAGFTASRILDEGYGEMTDLRPVGAGPGFNNVNNAWPRLPGGRCHSRAGQTSDQHTGASNRGHPLWGEPAGFTASRILDEGYGKMTDLRPVDAGSSFNNVNNGWPRLPECQQWMVPVAGCCPTPGCPSR